MCGVAGSWTCCWARSDDMTEQEWWGCTDPKQMLEFLRGKASDRRLRLFACACCRRIEHLLPDQLSQKAVEVAERFAEGLADALELLRAADSAYRLYYREEEVARRKDYTAAAQNARRDAAQAVYYGMGASADSDPEDIDIGEAL